MTGRPRVYAEAVSVLGRLYELGIEQHVLHEAILFAQRYASECTAHDPPSLAGILVWGKATRALRDLLVPKGWTASNARNYATVVHPSQGFAIAVAGGDMHTGQPDSTPATRSEKGPATRDAVAQNQLTFADLDPSFPRLIPTPVQQTWLLLHFADEDAGEIRLELSLPAEMTGDGYVSAWQERLILAPIPYGPAPVLGDEADDSGDIDVPVERRVS